MQLIPLILLASATCVGAHIAADELAYTFTNGAKSIGELLPRKWAKPLITCPTCMASVWGLAASVVFNIDLWSVPFFVLSLAFTNTLLYRWVS